MTPGEIKVPVKVEVSRSRALLGVITELCLGVSFVALTIKLCLWVLP